MAGGKPKYDQPNMLKPSDVPTRDETFEVVGAQGFMGGTGESTAYEAQELDWSNPDGPDAPGDPSHKTKGFHPVKRPGALTAKANRAHMGVQEFAKEHAHDSGLIGQQARFARIARKWKKG
jgi:hypothetical protein